MMLMGQSSMTMDFAWSEPIPEGRSEKPKTKSSRRGRKKTIRYTLADFEKPVITAEARLLDISDDAIVAEARETISDIRFQEGLPFFLLLAKLFRGSIDDFVENPLKNSVEIEFWRGTMCHYYGEMFCEFARLMFDIDTDMDGLRRAAEQKMGLPAYTLSPFCESLAVNEEMASRIAQGFSTIVRHHGHLHDPDADAFFEVRRLRRQP